MINKVFFFILTLGVISCSIIGSDDGTDELTYKEHLTSYLTEHYSDLATNSKIQSIQLANTPWLNKVYDEIDYQPIWIDDSLEVNESGKQLISLLRNSMDYGLDTNFYHGSVLNNNSNRLVNIKEKADRYELAASIELLLTNSYFLIGKDLNYGISNPDSTKLITEIPRKKFEIDLPDYLLNSIKSDSIIEKLLNIQPQHIEYKILQANLSNYLKTASLSKECITVVHFRMDSIKAYEQSKEALIIHNYLTENGNDSDYVAALKKFQTQHGLKPDGLIGKNTAKALSESPYENYKKAAMSLEKWRWKEDWKKDYIFVNIPACELKYYQNNVLKITHSVVVGKPDTHTPELDDEMEYMIVYPFWNLPYSISSKELLPKIKNDSTYLERNGYEVFTTKHKPLDATTINWNTVTETNFNYKIRQKGGGSNSLGKIKFIFPNEHSVYFHDTPSKSFFRNEIRAYSHGCVRVHRPLEMAEFILASDNNEYNIDTVNTYIKNQVQIRITLNQKIPVHIQYFTCGSDTAGNIVFYQDFYELDPKLEELMGFETQSKPANISELVSK